MTVQEIFDRVKMIISESCGIANENISLESTFFDSLAIDSIDMVDILYTVEMEYDISLKIADFEREARTELKGKPYEIDNVITPEGLKILKKRMPEIPPEKLGAGLTVYELMKLITVLSLCNLILHKINER